MRVDAIFGAVDETGMGALPTPAIWVWSMLGTTGGATGVFADKGGGGGRGVSVEDAGASLKVREDGDPQCGHVTAASETLPPHSTQGFTAIPVPPQV